MEKTLEIAEQAINQWLNKVAQDAILRIKQDYRKPKHGRWYFRHKRKDGAQGGQLLPIQSPAHLRAARKAGAIVHRASAPGEAPAIDTGNLDTFTHATNAVGMKVYIGVRANVHYAAELEFGNKRGRLEPRPFLRNNVLSALMANKPPMPIKPVLGEVKRGGVMVKA